jgi:hypothetical protein
MESNIHNRVAGARKAGRPIGSKSEPLPEPVEIVEIPQPPLTGIRCPSCGRSMVPRKDKTVPPSKCYAHCSLCAARLVLTHDGNKYVSVRRI